MTASDHTFASYRKPLDTGGIHKWVKAALNRCTSLLKILVKFPDICGDELLFTGNTCLPHIFTDLCLSAVNEGTIKQPVAQADRRGDQGAGFLHRNLPDAGARLRDCMAVDGGKGRYIRHVKRPAARSRLSARAMGRRTQAF